jgi:phage/plasmid-like protein (TIGR03299 family)
MFSVRETPWHGLGAVLDEPPATVGEAIDASGLGWSVAKEPIAVDRGGQSDRDWWLPRCEEIPGFYATVRQDTREVLGIVGERYRLVQNHEAFAFIDQLLGSSIHFETAGSLHGGRRVWVLATLPEHVEVGGDDVRPYVLLMNSHDGSTAVIAATTPIRVVCQNTLNWGLANARQKFSIRHTEAVTQRVHEARRVLDLSINYYEQFKRFGDQLASERCTERQLRVVLDELYPSGTSHSASGRLEVGGGERDRGVRRLAAPAALERPALRPRARRWTREDPRPAARRRCLTRQGPAGSELTGPAMTERWKSPAYSPTMEDQGVGPRGRFPPWSVCNGYPN